MATSAPPSPPRTPPSPPRRAHAVDCPAELLVRRRAVVRWALRRGTPLQRDALAAVIGARARSGAGADPGDGTECWATEDVTALLWLWIEEWCHAHGAVVPVREHVLQSLESYLRYLAAQRLLAPGSDAPAALRRAVQEAGGPPRSTAHPTVGGPAGGRVVPLSWA